MMQCPRCQTVADERVTAACPRCAAPLFVQSPVSQPTLQMAPPSAHMPQPTLQMPPGGGVPPGYVQAPMPGTPSPLMQPGTRVSLTGEVVESSRPTAASNLYGNTTVAMSPMQTGGPMPPVAARPTSTPYPRYREEVPDNSRRNALIINLSVGLFFLLLCVGGGGWYWTHRTNPKAQVTRYIHAIQWLDWGVVYDLSATPPGDKTRRDFVSTMNDKFDDNGLFKIGARKSMEKISFEIGEPTFQGNEATVPVTRGATLLGNSEKFQLTLTNYGGVWKIHPVAANPLYLMGSQVPTNAMPTIKPGMGSIFNY